MIPSIDRIDHIHVFVSDRKRAERWYREVLGLERIPELDFWAMEPGGPLAVANRAATVHLALFERPAQPCRSTIALAVGKDDFLAWRAHLGRALGRPPELQDHQVTWSMYFSDPDGNPFEITSHDYVALEPSLRREGR
jgi:catechol 2,3-dioxygenase-like lactoylglutathione lyase family enzyme